jgi:hypothetical protein
MAVKVEVERTKIDHGTGIAGFRKATSKLGPTHQCDNCKCKRYTPCTCSRKAKKD